MKIHELTVEKAKELKLIMLPGCQSTHQHQIPKTNKFVRQRINLTFRPYVDNKV